MCLIAFALNASARWPLVIAANRDEFWHRPTLPLQRWTTPAGVEVVCGRDLQAGGTWMGVSPGGRVAMLTNVREANPVAGPRSRGDLPLAWLSSLRSAASFLDELHNDQTAQHYAGFNLVIGDVQQGQWMWASNRQAGASTESALQTGWQTRPLSDGIYGLSNASLDTPWPKTQRLKTHLAQALQAQDEARLTAPLWQALADQGAAPVGELPRTGVPSEWEQALSSAFVHYPERGYGTRTSTLLLMQAADPQAAHSVRIYEKNTEPVEAGKGAKLSTHELQWPARLFSDR